MLEFLIFVILVAVFFGISLTAALRGIVLGTVIVIVASALICWLADVFEPVKPTQVKPKQKRVKVERKSHPVVKWVAIFIISYMLTFLFLIASGFMEAAIKDSLSLVIYYTIPALPFVAYAAYTILKKYIKKRAK